MSRRSLVVLAWCALTPLAAVRAGDKVHVVGKDGLKIEGKIAAGDPKVKVTEPDTNITVGLPAKTYQIKLKAGAKYRIDMIGPEIDPVLAIQDDMGKQIAFDDDGGEGLNSRLDFTAPADATYKFICASLKGTGAFTLTVVPAGAGKLIGGGKEMKFEGQVAQTDPKVRAVIIMNKGPELAAKLHEVKLAAGKKYQIDMVKKENNLDPFLVLQDKAGNQIAFDDDSGGDLNARIHFQCTKDDTYKIYAAALAGEGAYTLTIKEVALSKDEAKVHTVGAERLRIDGKLDNNSRSVTYQVKLEGGKTYTIDMLSPDQKALDPYLKLLDPNGKLLAEDDDGGYGLNARITIRAPVAGTYRIIATSFGGVGNGEFALEVRQE